MPNPRLEPGMSRVQVTSVAAQANLLGEHFWYKREFSEYRINNVE
jgi:hypothetical protein